MFRIQSHYRRVLFVTEILHIYSRVSTSVQELEGTSIDTQKEIGIKKSKELGFRYQVWDEGGQSSSKDDLLNRPVLTKLLDSVNKGQVKHLFVFNTDRLSRNEQTWSFIRLSLVKNDVKLYTATGVYDLNNPSDKLLFGILSEVSAYDNYLRSERSRLGKVKRIRQGFWMGGPTPFGYKVVDKKLSPEKNESKWVKFIFESYRDGKTVREIKHDLLKEGVLTRRGNSVWALGSIEKLLTNTHYGGYYIVKDHKSDEIIRVECPPLLSSTLILQVEKIKASRTRQTRVSESNLKNFYLLREFLFCSVCGSRYSGRTYPQQYRSTYYCPRIERNYVNEDTGKTQKCSNRRYLKIDETDNLVWQTVVEVISKSHLYKDKEKGEILGVQQTLSEQKEEIQKLKTKLKSIETEISDLTASIVNLETDEILKRRTSTEVRKILVNVEDARHKCTSKKESLIQQIYSLENRSSWNDWVGEFGKRIVKMSDFSPEEKSKLLKVMIEKIVVQTVDIQNHELTIHFRLPYVNDALVRKKKPKKGDSYSVRKGVTEISVPLDSSKKSLNSWFPC